MSTNLVPLSLLQPQVKPPDYLGYLQQQEQVRQLQQQSALRALQVEQMRRQMSDIEAMRQQGGPFRRLQDVATNGAAQTPMPGPIVQTPIPVGQGSALGAEGQEGVASLPPGAAPATAQPVPSQPQPPSQLPSSVERFQAYERMLYEHPYAFQLYGKDMIELEKNHLARQTQELGMQKDAMKMLSDFASSVQEQPPEARQAAWSAGYNMFRQWGLPGIEQWSPVYDSTAVQTLATNARSAFERTAQAHELSKIELERFGKETERIQAGTARYGAETERGRKVITPTQGGVITSGVTAAPGGAPTQPLATDAQGQPVMPPEFGQTRPLMTPGGDVILAPTNLGQGQQATGQRVQVPPKIPGYAAPSGQPGTAPAQPEVLMTPEEVGARHAAAREQLKEPYDQAEKARMALDTLDRMTDLLHQGIFTNPFARKMTGAEAQKFLVDVVGKDPEKLARTKDFQNLAQELVLANQGGAGLRVGQQEVGLLKGAAGKLEDIPPVQTIQQTIATARRMVKKNIENYNTMAREPERGLPPFAYKPKQTMSKADFDKAYADVKASGKSRAEFARFLEQRGYDVEGVY